MEFKIEQQHWDSLELLNINACMSWTENMGSVLWIDLQQHSPLRVYKKCKNEKKYWKVWRGTTVPMQN